MEELAKRAVAADGWRWMPGMLVLYGSKRGVGVRGPAVSEERVMSDTTQITRIHIHAPRPDRHELNKRDCPVCGPAAMFYEAHTPWYGWDASCLRCGERYADGGSLARPFCPQWRELNIEAARRQAAAAGLTLPPLERVRGYPNWETRRQVRGWKADA